MRYVRMWYIIRHTKTKRSRTRVHACTRARVHACTRARVHTRRLFFWDVSIRNSLRSNKKRKQLNKFSWRFRRRWLLAIIFFFTFSPGEVPSATSQAQALQLGLRRVNRIPIWGGKFLGVSVKLSPKRDCCSNWVNEPNQKALWTANHRMFQLAA